MFDVDRAVTRLSESVYADRCASAARVEELRDHIHCEIDRARAQGMSAEQAFAAAAAKLGTRAGLAAEYAKNRSLFGLICAWDARQERGLRGRVPAAILTAHGIVWATAMVAGSLVM